MGPVWERGGPMHKHHVITASKNMQELSEHPDLSQRAVYADLFGFKYSLSQFEHNEEKTARTRLFGRVLHEQKARLQELEPAIRSRLQATLPQVLSGWLWTGDAYLVQTAPALRRLAGTLMCDLLIGPTLADEPELREALLQHPKDMISFAKAYQVCPKFLAPLVYNLITHEDQAMQTIMKRLIPVAAEEVGSWKAPQEEKSLSILGNMINSSSGNDYWTPHRIVQALSGIWFAAAQQPRTILDFVLLELYSRPEYIPLIRHELDAAGTLDFNKLE
ncbi:MAG: hypothetical protein M1828_006224 [Chrysothrix sp. TS-e1954]|nr:MAG: hypothetical protein M1828_006224 [Chrysothrix sp. TS-e1954]